MKKIYFEDFSDFKIGEFPYDLNHSALGEYHHYMPQGYRGNFYDPINNHQFRSMDGSWLITNKNNMQYLQQNRGNVTKGHFANLESLLVHSKFEGQNFTISTKLMMLSTKDYTGLAFNYLHSQDYYSVKLYGHKITLDHKNYDQLQTLAFSFYQFKALNEYELTIEKTNQYIKVFINNQEVLLYILKEALPLGKVGFISLNPAKYQYLEIKQDLKDQKVSKDHLTNRLKEVEQKSKKFSDIEVIKKIKLNGKGSGRHMRCANVDGQMIFLFAQHEKLMYRDAYANISAISAFDINGKNLWQIGVTKPDESVGLISCDLPWQIADINNDGKPELIYAKDFQINIIDLVTGQPLKSFNTPFIKDDKLVAQDYPFDYLNVDAIRVADFTKKGYQGDLMVKDRYQNVWGLDGTSGQILFRYNHKNTGHFPYIYDFDQDGIDEMFVGYDMTKDGQVLWSLPYNSDHTDEIIYERLKEDEDKVILLASGNEGFNVVDINGNIIKHIPVGHAQRISLGKFDPTKIGYQVCVTSFWGANGIIYTFDSDLALITAKEFIGNGNVITPINYDNDEQNLILASTDAYYGGLMDANLDMVVKFKAEGQPTLACEAFDIDNDGVDEILTWDMNNLWIYKASKLKPHKHQYERYAHNAFSNYRGEYIVKKK